MSFTVYESRNKKIVEIFNEFTLLFCTYFLHLSSNLINSPEDRYRFGYAFISLILLNVGVQLILLIATALMGVKLCWRKRYVRQMIKMKTKKPISNKQEKSIAPEQNVLNV